MLRILQIVLVVGAITVLSACAIPASLKYRSSSELNNLSVGMTKNQVFALLGMPESKTSSAGLECLQYALAVPGRSYPPGDYSVYFDAAQRVAEFGSGICYSNKLQEIAGKH